MARRWRQQNQDPTRVPAAQLGSAALPNDFLRPYKGYSGIRMWDYSGYGNYNSLQTSVTRRFDGGFMFSGFFVWSKALGINNDDFSPGVPNLSDEETRALDYSYLNYDRPFNFVFNFIYQTPNVTSSKMLGILANEWQFSGAYRWTSGRPYAVGFKIPDINSLNLTGTDTPNARIVLTCDPGKGWSDDPYRQLNTDCFAPPQPGSNGNESARFFVRAPPINNIDLSISKNVAVVKTVKFEIRLDMFNFLNHTQFTGVNATANFASLTDRRITNLPDQCQRRAGASKRRVWDHHQRRSSAHAAARHPRHVLARVIAAIGRPAPDKGAGLFLRPGTSTTCLLTLRGT